MLPLNKTRRYEIKVGSEWVDAPMSRLETGDTFRVFEPDGTQLVIEGVTEFQAGDTPYVLIYVNNEEISLVPDAGPHL